MTAPDSPPPSGFEQWRRSTFRALRHESYRKFWLSQLLSLVGGWMQSTAQSYLVLELTHNNAAALGWVTMVQFTPSLLLSLFAGAVIDRTSRRRVLLSTQITLLGTSLLLAFSTQQGFIGLPLLLLIAFVSGTANAFDAPARQSMVMDFVPRDDMANAVALNSLSFNVSRTLGQALFGVVAALGAQLLGSGSQGLALAFYLNSASFVAVIYTIATLPFPPRQVGGSKDVLGDIREGLKYVRATPAILYTMLLLALLSVTVINFNVIIPYFAKAVYGLKEGGFGLLNAVFGIGAMAGALWQASQKDPARNLRLGGLMVVSSAALFALMPQVWLGGLLLVGCGAGMLTFLISANSTVQLTVPNELRGRVMSLYSLVLLGMAPLGALVVSTLISATGPLGSRGGLLVVAGLGAASLALLWNKLPRGVKKNG